MAVSTTVLCNCVNEGLEVPKPFRNVLLNDKGELSVNFKVSEGKWNKFDEWRQVACQHNDMTGFFQFVSSGGHMWHFMGHLENYDEEAFRTLLSLPLFDKSVCSSVEEVIAMKAELSSLLTRRSRVKYWHRHYRGLIHNLNTSFDESIRLGNALWWG